MGETRGPVPLPQKKLLGGRKRKRPPTFATFSKNKKAQLTQRERATAVHV